MPTRGIRAELLDELHEHHARRTQQSFQHLSSERLADLSDDSDGFEADLSMSDPVSSVGMSIDTLDMDMSSISSDSSESPSSSLSQSGTESFSDSSDFEMEFYLEYEQRFRQKVYEIETTCVLQPAPPVLKASQLDFGWWSG